VRRNGKNNETLLAMGMDVEVDAKTGVIRVLRVACAHDRGQIIAPDGVRALTALGALLQEKRHLDPERFGGDEVESDNKAWSQLGEKKIPNASGTAMQAVDN
jgi:hypothetical protein